MSNGEPTDGRLLCHIATVTTRWFKVSSWLLEFGRKGVPDNRDSYNPVRWIAAQVGSWMSDRQSRYINKLYDKDPEFAVAQAKWRMRK